MRQYREPRSRAPPHDALAAAESAAGAAPIRVTMEVTPVTAGHFRTLDDALEDALRLGESRRFLTPPIQPELRQLRQWLCGQVAAQSLGESARAWQPMTKDLLPVDIRPSPVWDSASVSGSSRAALAVDDTGRICAASSVAAAALGYGRDDLLGLRLVALVPARFREAHLAGFTLHQLTRDGALLDTPIVVPFLGHNGTEIRMQLTIHEQPTDDARSVFIADLDPSAFLGVDGLGSPRS